MLIAFASRQSSSQETGAAKTSQPVVRKLFIEPASSSLAGGKARLVVTELNREPGTYAGDYQLKVTPYFFKSEKGKLAMSISDEALQKLRQAVPVELTGKATAKGSGKTRVINAKARPTAHDRGAVTISVTTENGPLVFETFYHFGDK